MDWIFELRQMKGSLMILAALIMIGLAVAALQAGFPAAVDGASRAANPASVAQGARPVEGAVTAFESPLAQSRSWKPDEIGAVPGEGAESAIPVLAADALSLGSFFDAQENGGVETTYAPRQRSWKADEIGATDDGFIEVARGSALEVDATSLGAQFSAVATADQAQSHIQSQLQSKIEGLLAEEGLVAGSPPAGERCRPSASTGQQAC